MKWYTDYLSAYEKPYSELPPPLTNRVKKRIRELKHPNPLVSVVAIAHNMVDMRKQLSLSHRNHSRQQPFYR